MTTTARLEGWSITNGASPYTPPEFRHIRLEGTVFNHALQADGTFIATSHVVEAAGNLIQTASGTWYSLGQPSKHYLDWLATQGIAFDPVSPVKVVGIGPTK